MLEPVRSADDHGEVDGYFGKYDRTLVVNPVNFKKIETPKGMETTLVVSHNEKGFCWTCRDCGDKMFSDKFTRPLHSCSRVA